MAQQTVQASIPHSSTSTTISGRTQWTRLSTSGDPNRVPRGGGSASGIFSIAKG